MRFSSRSSGSTARNILEAALGWRWRNELSSNMAGAFGWSLPPARALPFRSASLLWIESLRKPRAHAAFVALVCKIYMLLSRRLSRVRVLPDGFPITSFGTEAATTVSGCNLLAVGNSAKSSTRGRQKRALDYRNNPFCDVAARDGHFLHTWRFPASVIGFGDHRHVDPGHSGKESDLNI
jgi:hypothetical protein